MEVYDETRDYTLEELETLRSALLIMVKDPNLSQEDEDHICWDVRDIDRDIRAITGEKLPPLVFYTGHMGGGIKNIQVGEIEVVEMPAPTLKTFQTRVLD